MHWTSCSDSQTCVLSRMWKPSCAASCSHQSDRSQNSINNSEHNFKHRWSLNIHMVSTHLVSYCLLFSGDTLVLSTQVVDVYVPQQKTYIDRSSIETDLWTIWRTCNAYRYCRLIGLLCLIHSQIEVYPYMNRTCLWRQQLIWVWIFHMVRTMRWLSGYSSFFRSEFPAFFSDSVKILAGHWYCIFLTRSVANQSTTLFLSPCDWMTF